MKTIVALLLASCVVSLAQTDSNINTPLDATEQLLSAAKSGDMETVKLALKNGADVNAKGDIGTNIFLHGSTALMWAAMGGHTNMVKLLLDKGADINAKRTSGATALMEAAITGQTDVVKLLLDKGADINAKDNDGATALLFATYTDQTNAIRFLLDKGADINVKNNDGTTALTFAAMTGERNMVKLLLDKGADINAKDNDGDTAMKYAQTMHETGIMHDTAIVQLLQQAAANSPSVTGKAVNAVVASGTNTDSQGYVTNATLLTPFTLTNAVGDVITNAILVKLMPDKFIYKTPTGTMGTRRLDTLSPELQKRFGYDAASAAANMHGQTALDLARMSSATHSSTGGKTISVSETDKLLDAAIDGDIETIKSSLENGADINAKDDKGYTALAFAAEKGHADVVKLLLDKGADINAKDNDGVTALIWASGQDYPDMIRLLLDRGADINAKANVGYTALMVADAEGHTAIVQLLKQAAASRSSASGKSFNAAVASDKPEFEVITATAKATEQNNVWWRYGYRLTVRNNGIDNDRQFFEIQFLDAEGYVIDTKTEEAVIKPGTTEIITGDKLIELPGAARVSKLKVVWKQL